MHSSMPSSNWLDLAAKLGWAKGGVFVEFYTKLCGVSVSGRLLQRVIGYIDGSFLSAPHVLSLHCPLIDDKLCEPIAFA